MRERGGVDVGPPGESEEAPASAEVATLRGGSGIEDETREPTPTVDTNVERPSLTGRIILAIERFGVLGLIGLLTIWFSTESDTFLTVDNLMNVVRRSSFLMVAALGATVVRVVQRFDLSIGWIGTLAGAVSAGVAIDTNSTLAGVAAGIGVGLAAGAVNGALTMYLRVESLITTLATSTVMNGLVLWYTGGTIISFGLPASFRTIGTEEGFGLSYAIWVALGAIVAIYVLLKLTELGMGMYATGANPVAARLAGVRTAFSGFAAFIIAGTLSALAGVLIASNVGGGDPQGALGLLFDSYTACYIGAATWRRGAFHIPGTVIGVLAIGVVANGLVHAGVTGELQIAAKGTLLLLAVTVSTVARNHSQTRRD